MGNRIVRRALDRMSKRVTKIQGRARARFEPVVGHRHRLYLDCRRQQLEPRPPANRMRREFFQKSEEVAALNDRGLDDFRESLAKGLRRKRLQRVYAAEN